MSKRILVIEDNPKHLADVKAFFIGKPEYQVTYLQDGNSALMALMKTNEWHNFECDAVITDIMVPCYPGSSVEQPIGFGVALLCQKLGIPYVMCTAGHHHGEKYNWINVLCSPLGLIHMLDRLQGVELMEQADRESWEENQLWAAEPKDQPNVESPRKAWPQALQLLEEQFLKPKS